MKSTPRLSFFIFFSIALFLGCQQSKPVAVIPEASTSLEKKLQEAFHESGLNSVAFGYITSRGEKFTSCFGTVSEMGNTQLGPDNIFRIASMTKAITSLAVLQLVERGLLSLNDFAGDFLPEIDLIPILENNGSLIQPQSRPTIKQLLTHTSGFSYDLFDQRLKEFMKPADWLHQDYPKVFEAGAGWVYGTGIDWAGKIIEAVSGLSLEDYFRQHITGPLNMHHTWFNVPESQHHLIVPLYMRQDGGTYLESPARSPQRAQQYSGGGGLYSSLNDYLKFLQCILNQGELDGKRILGEEWVDLMFVDLLPGILTPETSPAAMGHSPAWVIQLNDNDFGRRAGSAYWSGYFNTYFSIDKNSGVAVVVMTNIMPFLDPATLNLYKLFESLVRQ